METPSTLLPDTAYCREHCTKLDGTLGRCALLDAISRVSSPAPNYESLEVLCTRARCEQATEVTED